MSEFYKFISPEVQMYNKLCCLVLFNCSSLSCFRFCCLCFPFRIFQICVVVVGSAHVVDINGRRSPMLPLISAGHSCPMP